MLKRLAFLIVVLAGSWLLWRTITAEDRKLKRASGLSESSSAAPQLLSQDENKTSSATGKEAQEKEVPVSPSQAGPTSDSIGNEQEFRRQFPGDWRIRKTALGKVYSLSGAAIPGAGRSPDAALRLAKQLSSFLASGEFTLDHSVKMEAETGYVQKFNVRQLAQGLAVYQGSVGIFGQKKSGEAYLINNRLKEIFPFDASIEFDQMQARQRLAGKYPDSEISGELPAVVFSNDVDLTEVAWVLRVRSSVPEPQSLHVVVSAKDGRILHTERRVRKN